MGDQENINKFSRMNIRYDDLEAEIQVLKKNIQEYKDAQEEIDGCMEDNGIFFKVGECFTPADEDVVGDRLGRMREEAEESLRRKADDIEGTKVKLDALKKLLYGKFG